MKPTALRTAVLSALSLFFSFDFAHAQYNKSFDQRATPEDVVACNNGEYCTVSTITGFRRYDYSGNLLWERTYSNLPLNRPFWQRLVHTDDDGVIFFTLDANYNPIACKIDNSGNLVWSQQYQSNSNDSVDMDAGMRLDIIRMQNTRDEGYLMVTSGKPDVVDPRDALPPYKFRNVLNVLRIDGAGNLVWNRKYTEAISDAYFVNDLANTISYGGTDDFGNNNYYVAGVRRVHPMSGTSGAYYFQLSIDESGNIVNNYQALTICGYPEHIDAVYDANDNSVVTSFMFGDCTQVGQGVSSQIGLLKLDHSLNITMQKYYWFPVCNESMPYYIKKSVIDGSYLISGQVNDRTTFGGSFEVPNFFLLKLRTDGVPIFSKRYIVANTGIDRGLIVNYNPAINDENYVMVGQSAPYNGSTGYSARIISTDNTGVVCGHWDFPIRYDDVNLPYTSLNYAPYDVYGQNDYLVPEIDPFITGYHDCFYYHESGYRKAPATAIEETAVQCKVYPTILTENENELSIDLKMTEASNLKLTVYNMVGGQITERKYNNVSATTLKLSLADLLPGNYLINVRSDNKEINTVVQFSKL